MRIISGKYKSRIIQTVDNLNTRPVTDRIKESIFNILIHRYSIEERLTLDLYAGSGSFGIEALSRGAKRIVFIERDPESYKILVKNIQSLKCENECETYKINVENYIERSSDKYDLIFCDPPFKMEEPEKIVSKIFEKDILSQNGLLVYRCNHKTEFLRTDIEILHDKKIGISYIYIMRKK